MDWENYEELTKYIYEALGKSHDIKILGYGRNCKVKGVSDVEHQIDVYTEHETDDKKITTAIECKYYKSNVSKDPIMKLAQILDDCNVDRGVIVAQSGFTPDAVKFAKHKKISLVELRAPLDKDWADKARDMTCFIKYYVPFTYDVNLIGDIISDETLDINDATIQSLGSCPTSLYDFINEKCKEADWHSKDITEVSMDFEEETKLFFRNKKVAVLTGLDFKIKKTLEFESKNEFKGDDLVAFYMNMIFENRELHLRKDGTLHELTTIS